LLWGGVHPALDLVEGFCEVPDGKGLAETSVPFVPLEGPIRRTREGGSEWEPIKILLEGDGNSNKMKAASNTLPKLVKPT
jgi:hypothetical protein